MPDGLTRLDQAIEDLNSIQTGNHNNTKSYGAVTEKLNRLSFALRKYYPADGQAAPVLDENALGEIRSAYSAAGRACADYLSGKGDTRSSGYGQGRLHCVRELGRIISEDLSAVQSVRAQDGKTLRDVIEEARRMDIRLSDPDHITTVGGSMNSRIPVSMETQQGPAEGFFTKNNRQPEFIDVAPHFYETYSKAKGMAPVLGKRCMKDPSKLSSSGLNDYYSQLVVFDVMRNRIYTNAVRNKLNCSSRWMISDPKAFNDVFGRSLKNLYGREHAILLINDEEARRNFVNFMDDIEFRFRPYMLNKSIVGIKDGEEIAKRNVGMTRIADALGMHGLIARSVTAKMNTGGREESGIFMEMVKDASDINSLKENDPLLTLKDDPGQINAPEVLRQLSDLQVLDYICGNTDRHSGNILYRFEEVDGKKRLCGIVGIDNDMSLGEVAPGENRMIDVSSMRVMRRSTADEIASMDEKKLRLMLQDLNPTDGEIKAAMSRIETLQKELRKTSDRKIEILEDDEFARRKASDFSVKPVNAAGEGCNYFYTLANLPEMAKDSVRKKPKSITFNQAEFIPKNYQREELPVYVTDLGNSREELQRALQKFESTKRFLHKDTGSFKWMRDSMQEVVDRIGQMEEKYKGVKNAALAPEDAGDLDRLYRQLRNASSEYVKTHPEYKKEGSMGEIRKTQAQLMTGLYPPRLDAKAEVREMGINEMIAIKTGKLADGFAKNAAGNEGKGKKKTLNMSPDNDNIIARNSF